MPNPDVLPETIIPFSKVGALRHPNTPRGHLDLGELPGSNLRSSDGLCGIKNIPHL